MELQFEKNAWSCLTTVVAQTKNEEQTQEVRLGDAMPDIGRILGTWGQFLVRGKEWRGNGMAVSGGIMAWVLYAPEDGSEPQTVETWMPVQLRWDFPETNHDGTIMVDAQLAGMDARSLSARKLLIRASVSIHGQALEPGSVDVWSPGDLPEDVMVLKRNYPVCLPREAGEKAFSLEESVLLPVPASRLVYYTLRPEIQDTNVLAGKAVFRGTVCVHILFAGQNGEIQSHDQEFSFSQFADLDGDFDTDCQVRVIPAVTNLEMNLEEGDRVNVVCGLLGQFCVSDCPVLEVVEDAYSNCRPVTIQQEMLMLPVELEQAPYTLRFNGEEHSDLKRIVDVVFSCGQPRIEREPGKTVLAQEGVFQALCDTPAGLRGTQVRSSQSIEIPTGADASLRAYGAPNGQPQAVVGADGISLRSDAGITTVTTTDRGIPMVTGLALGETVKPDPKRPSLILRRSGEQGLWELAKSCGSTVEQIVQVNQLQGEPEEDRMLLIPVQ